MSEARWCDTCGRTYSSLDERASKMSIEKKVQDGVRMVTQTIERDACGDCMDKLNNRTPTAAIEATAGPVPATVVEP